MLLESRRRAAGVLVTLLAVALVVALLPYASGLLAGPVLYILWLPLYERLVRRLPARIAAGIILALTLLIVVLPGFWLMSLVLSEAQAAVGMVLQGPVLERLAGVELGRFAVGPLLAEVGDTFFRWLGQNAFSMIGTATRFILGLLFMLVGLYYLLLGSGSAWAAVVPYIPVTPERALALRQRFHDITWSTVIGIGLNALIQSLLVGGALALAGIPNAAFWGVVTAALSILPVVGSGMVWGPAALSLLVAGRPGAGLALLLWGFVVVANVDNLLRPWVYRRYAQVHPMITLVGAVMGVEYFGLVGLVLGPLAIQYFFELVRMFREEHVQGWWGEA